MQTKNTELSSAEDVIVPLRRDAEPRARSQQTPAPAGTRKEQLRRQRERIQEYLETIQRVTDERDEARAQVEALGDLADRMLTRAETSARQVLVLENEVAALTAENDALLSQAFQQAEKIDLLEYRVRVLLAD